MIDRLDEDVRAVLGNRDRASVACVHAWRKAHGVQLVANIGSTPLSITMKRIVAISRPEVPLHEALWCSAVLLGALCALAFKIRTAADLQPLHALLDRGLVAQGTYKRQSS